MIKLEFINKMIGVPWRNRAIGFDATDCWGLVLLYFSEVLKVKIPVYDAFSSGEDFDRCFNHEVSNWELTGNPDENIVFTAYKNGRPCHVGVCINKTHAIHARGSESNAGKVEMHSLRAIEKTYGKLTYHRFNNA